MSLELFGIALTALLGSIGWWLRRERERRALAYLLALDAKFVRNWAQAVQHGQSIPAYATLPVWRANQAVVADLFPRWCSVQMVDVYWLMESQDKTVLLNSGGLENCQMEAAAVQVAFDWYAGNSVRVSYPADLSAYAEAHGAPRLLWRPPLWHRGVKLLAVRLGVPVWLLAFAMSGVAAIAWWHFG